MSQKSLIYLDFGVTVKIFLRSIAISLSLCFALQSYFNGFHTNTHFKAIFATCLFVASLQVILAFVNHFKPWITRVLVDRHLLWMFEVFLDFFSLSIALLNGSIALNRCGSSTPVQPCYHTLMRLPLVGCTTVGSICLCIFVLTLMAK
jgi:hypothetical protein